jgi:hypothetical protein
MIATSRAMDAMAMPAIWAVVRGTGVDRCIGRLVAVIIGDKLNAEVTDGTALELGVMTVVVEIEVEIEVELDLIAVLVEVAITVIVMLTSTGVAKS